MTMGQVTWELSGGIRALRTLTDMLYEAASACGLKAQMVGDKSWMGVYLDGKNYWIGVYFDRPEMLIFETDMMPVNKEAAEQLGIGTVEEWRGGHSWLRELNLESEEVHFFARSKASQMQVLESYLEESLKQVKQIEIRNAT